MGLDIKIEKPLSRWDLKDGNGEFRRLSVKGERESRGLLDGGWEQRLMDFLKKKNLGFC